MIHYRSNDAFRKVEQAEFDHPVPRKEQESRTVHRSRLLPWSDSWGLPILCDFGEARFGQDSYVGQVQPHAYRAPEVTLRMQWTSKIDIWMIGAFVCRTV